MVNVNTTLPMFSIHNLRETHNDNINHDINSSYNTCNIGDSITILNKNKNNKTINSNDDTNLTGVVKYFGYLPFATNNVSIVLGYVRQNTLSLSMDIATIVLQYYCNEKHISKNKKVFGVTLDKWNVNGHNGIFNGKKIFDTLPGYGMFVNQFDIIKINSRKNTKNKVNLCHFELKLKENIKWLQIGDIVNIYDSFWNKTLNNCIVKYIGPFVTANQTIFIGVESQQHKQLKFFQRNQIMSVFPKS